MTQHLGLLPLSCLKPVSSLALFDVDHTLLSVNVSFRFGVYLFRQGLFSSSTMVYLALCYWRHKALGMPLKTLHHKIFQKLFLGKPLALFEEQARKFLDESFDKMLYLPAFNRLKEIQAAGGCTLILSSSPDFLIQQIAERLQVNGWAGSCYAVDKDRKLCTISHLMEGVDKAKICSSYAAQLGLDISATVAFSDSLLDLHFLEAAGRAVVVNPDKKLLKISRQKGWERL